VCCRARYLQVTCGTQHATETAGETVDEVVEYCYRFLARNNYPGHLKRFTDELESDPKACSFQACACTPKGSPELMANFVGGEEPLIQGYCGTACLDVLRL
jgi:hypothetical protein